MNSKPFFLIVIVLLFFPTNNLRASAPIVGYGSTGTALSPTDRAIFKSGFELGVKAALKVKLPENWLLMLDSPEQGELSPKAVGQKLVDSGISLLVGFPTSHEALMMGELSRKNNLLSFSAAAGHQDLDQMGPTVFSCAESMDLLSRFFLQSIDKYFKSTKGLLVISPKSVFSVNQRKSMFRMMKSLKLSRNITVETLKIDDPKEKLSEENVARLKRQDYDFVFISIYSDESGPLFTYLNQLPKHVPIYTSTWMGTDTEMHRQLLKHYRAAVYGMAIWMPGHPGSQEFEQRVRRALGKEPSAEIAYSYDMGVVAATILNRAGGDYSRKGLFEAFQSNPCFPNTSSGELCFERKGGHALRKLHLAQFVKEKGFILPIESPQK